ncbi:MAG: hypothetical protein OSB47_09825 [Pirellulaceae bacterium]|nr:hypothetical protein [Pirellulaceae bacterium]
MRKYFRHLVISNWWRALAPWYACLLVTGILLANTGTVQSRQQQPAKSSPDSDSPGELPWKKSGRSPRPPSRAEVTPRQLLKIYGLDDSHLSFLGDGDAWSPEAEDTTTKILLNLEKDNLQILDRWSQETVPWQEMTKEPAPYRLQVFRLRGRARKIEKITLVKEAAELVQFDHYYRVHVHVTGTPHTAIIFTRRYPEAWKPGQSLDERVELSGLFLKVGPAGQQGQEFWFATPRIAWLPDQAIPSEGITQHHVLLANRGVDIGLFSRITRQTRREFIGDERECFFQLLKAVADPAGASLSGANPRPLKIAGLLRKPREFQGQLFTIEGTARWITRIVVEDPEIQQRFGLDHYYQVDMFVSLGGKSVQIKRHSKDQDAPVFENRYPVNICVRNLPPALKEMNRELAAGNQDQDLLRANVRIQGFFFKLWSYQTEFVSDEQQERTQLSPVFIASTPEVILSEEPRNPYLSSLFAAIFILTLVVIWFFLWRNNRADQEFSQTTLKRHQEADAMESLGELTGPAQETEAEPTPSP